MVNDLIKFMTIALLVMNNSFSYHPSLESLLSNGANIEVGNNSVVGNFIIEERKDTMNLMAESEVVLNEKHALKLHLFNENELTPELARVHYKAGVMSNATLVNHDQSMLMNIKKLIGHDENYEAEIFYGLMALLLNNQGKPLLKALKRRGLNLKSNKELLDPEKAELLSRYKKYLVKKKDDPESEIEDPLNPSDPEVKEKVEEILQRSFLTKDTEVKRVKDGKEFFWIVEDENLFLKFNKNHRFRELKIKTSIGQIEVILGRFVLWSGQMQFPEFILFKTVEGRWFEIKPSKIATFPDNRDQYRRRLKKYEKLAEENKILEPHNRPSFML